jgi:carbon storage regulator
VLVLSRRKGEKIMIGANIEVQVVDIRGDRVRLGIVAPKEVVVHREETYLRCKQEHEALVQPIDSKPATDGIGC